MPVSVDANISTVVCVSVIDSVPASVDVITVGPPLAVYVIIALPGW